MAERRMIARSISVSEQVATLESDFARLLFTWMIAHADDYGVLTGSAMRVRAMVVPMLDHTVADVESALADMERHELIWRYNHDGLPWLQFRTWETHQSGLHKRTTPKQPRYCIPENPDDSGDFPDAQEFPGSSRSLPEVPGLARARGREEEKEQKGIEKEYGSGSEGVGSALTIDAADAAGGADAPTDSSSKSSVKSFSPDAPPYQLAVQLRDAVLAHNPQATDAVKAKTPSSIQAWARQMETLLREKRRAPPDIEAIITYAAGDHFWRPIILNPAKLKKHLDTIDGQRRESANGGNGHAKAGHTGKNSGPRRVTHAGGHAGGEYDTTDWNGYFITGEEPDEVLARRGLGNSLPAIGGNASGHDASRASNAHSTGRP